MGIWKHSKTFINLTTLQKNKKEGEGRRAVLFYRESYRKKVFEQLL